MSKQPDEKSCKSKCNFSHLTLTQREYLRSCLRSGDKQKEIAAKLNVHKTTITREILAHRKLVTNHRKKGKNFCVHLQHCTHRNICHEMHCQTECKHCAYGKDCNTICKDFQMTECKRLNRFPYVCDGCPTINSCRKDFYYYDPSKAHEEAMATLITSRRGIDMTEEDFASLDRLLVEGTQKGQSVEHIIHANQLSISSRTVRNYIKQGLTTIKPMDTPRGASYKPRTPKISKSLQKAVRSAKVGRDLSAFLNYAKTAYLLHYAQVDTVEGTKSEKCRLLTLILVRERLFYCVPLENGLSSSVTAAFDNLYLNLGHSLFSEFFGTLLTDNGSEFYDINGIELNDSQELRSRVFFCDPYASWEKGTIEVCHELLRRIIPKGSSLHGITKEHTNLINSHINSYIRESDGWKSAYDVFIEVYGESGKEFLEKLEIQRIEPQDVILHPSLLKQVNHMEVTAND